MGIDIAYYITKIEEIIRESCESSSKQGLQTGEIGYQQIKEILLPQIHVLAQQLEKELYNEVCVREGVSYNAGSNEMNLLCLAVILSAWCSWCFKAKSDDINRELASRRQAAAVENYIGSVIDNAVYAGKRIGRGNGRPEGRSLVIDLTK